MFKLLFVALDEEKTQLMVLPFNTGGTGGKFYGHRIYAGIPHLLNADRSESIKLCSTVILSIL